MLPGIKELAEKAFDLPVRIGIPYRFRGLGDVVKNPIYATATGLILYGWKHGSPIMAEKPRLIQRIFETMRDWFREFW